MVIPDALKVLRLQHGHRYCQLVRRMALLLGRDPAAWVQRRRSAWLWAFMEACMHASPVGSRIHRLIMLLALPPSGHRSALPLTLPLPSSPPRPSQGPLATSVGWKHEEAVKALEAKRKVKVRSLTSPATRQPAPLEQRHCFRSPAADALKGRTQTITAHWLGLCCTCLALQGCAGHPIPHCPALPSPSLILLPNFPCSLLPTTRPRRS